MFKIRFEKYKERVEDVKRVITGDLTNTQNVVQNDKNLKNLLNFNTFIVKNYFDASTRHEEYFNNEIMPLLSDIKKIEKDKKEEIKRFVTMSSTPKITLANLMKKHAVWLIEDIVLADPVIKSIYKHILRDMDEEDSKVVKRRIIAVDAEGNETLYENLYRVATSLGIHHSSIRRCCNKNESRISATSKKDKKVYRFYYEGDEPPGPVIKQRPNYTKIDKLLKKYKE